MVGLAAPVQTDGTGFASAAQNALSYLRKTTGFGLWMVTRVEGGDWIVLQSEDRGYGLKVPALFRWTDSFCSRMVRGEGPRVAPISADVPAYADAPIGRIVDIGAYIGVPLTNHDGTLFGTLCAIDPQPQPESIRASLPLVELVAGMLSGILSAEIRATQLSRQAERAQSQAETDFLTGLFNRRGWDRAFSVEEARCLLYGHSACIIAIDLDGLKRVNDLEGHEAGDRLIVRAGAVIKSAIREVDVVARVGGDEFLVLGVECDEHGGQSIVDRLTIMLNDAGVEASLGMAKRQPTSTLDDAVREADRRMYADKRQRKQCTAAR